ncbi:TlyA family RNA methyltransferase [Crassaminicella thermophila]|uniref:TlyA family RNA methyltransferase n=1 Tax=Crassaminicella thermophila TaxID=2599308 RepID=A0A5C0SGR9_CRATE|nr:TlyA family RNA methyltransferase [Crassaminicella thermophila]QEK12159.1 TlyA family RNA methyltransferase [Crassaminicella thermophila]
MGEKKRLDIVLVERGFFDSREKAKKSIMSGVIFVNNQRVDKAGTNIHVDAEIEIKGKVLPYVSRGGLKLEKAIETFNIDLRNKTALDIGASTGGFTDCMLINGAKKVFAIDVGYGQLAWKLRKDERVVPMERTNIRYVTKENINEEIDFASIDVSFISLKLVLPVVKNLVKENGEIVCLIKPQFEAGREKVGKKGVIRDINVHKEVIINILSFIADIGLSIKGLSFSPIKGPEGNIEYLAYLINKEMDKKVDIEGMAQDIVNSSHSTLNKR